MKIILLSGGSGKRLWPLSNHTRSKQFLRLLNSPEGGTESMVQRVVRQIREEGISDSVTIATSASQQEIITGQLGADANIVTEPERRDTFPAIALACTYLAKEKLCNDNEAVIVMPCDSYTDANYFKTIAKMATAVENNVADLVLMGIKPKYPSTKFGYIVPVRENADKSFLYVKGFTEKPDEEHAESLIADGALWNGGVFAFRLGYMTDIVKRYLDVHSFEELHSRYRELPKISFDYEVVEKAESIAVIPFNGQWKDLGTWNSLTEELTHYIGNVTAGKNVHNTHVINELNIPLLCCDIDNLIIAANYDGILVCGKESCEHIKDYVNELPSRPMYGECSWGTYKVVDFSTFAGGYQSLTQLLQLKAGFDICYRGHQYRDISWTCIDGSGTLVLDGQVRNIQRGDIIHIGKGHRYAVKAVSNLQIIEVQTGDRLTDNDVEYLDWNW